MSIRVLDPTYTAGGTEMTAATHLRSFAGRTVGLLDNGKPNVREFLDYVEEIFRSRYGVGNVARLKKPDASRPAPPEVLRQMTACDAVISAVGD